MGHIHRSNDLSQLFNFRRMKKKKPKADKEDKDKEKKIPANTDENKACEANGSDDRFDFGGLPHRDLKKNLGCG